MLCARRLKPFCDPNLHNVGMEDVWMIARTGLGWNILTLKKASSQDKQNITSDS